MSYDLSEINRILAGLIRIGTVTALTGNKVRVRCGENTTPLIPWLTEAADGDRNWRPPKVGAQVVVLAPGGDTAQAVVLRSLYQTQAAAPAEGPDVDHHEYADGAVMAYNRAASALSVTLPSKGSANVTVGGSSIVIDDGQILLSSNGKSLKIDAGGLAIVGAVAQTGGDITSDGISVQTHFHIEQGDGKPVSLPQ